MCGGACGSARRWCVGRAGTQAGNAWGAARRAAQHSMLSSSSLAAPKCVCQHALATDVLATAPHRIHHLPPVQHAAAAATVVCWVFSWCRLRSGSEPRAVAQAAAAAAAAAAKRLGGLLRRRPVLRALLPGLQVCACHLLQSALVLLLRLRLLLGAAAARPHAVRALIFARVRRLRQRGGRLPAQMLAQPLALLRRLRQLLHVLGAGGGGAGQGSRGRRRRRRQCASGACARRAGCCQSSQQRCTAPEHGWRRQGGGRAERRGLWDTARGVGGAGLLCKRRSAATDARKNAGQGPSRELRPQLRLLRARKFSPGLLGVDTRSLQWRSCRDCCQPRPPGLQPLHLRCSALCWRGGATERRRGAWGGPPELHRCRALYLQHSMP